MKKDKRRQEVVNHLRKFEIKGEEFGIDRVLRGELSPKQERAVRDQIAQDELMLVIFAEAVESFVEEQYAQLKTPLKLFLRVDEQEPVELSGRDKEVAFETVFAQDVRCLTVENEAELPLLHIDLRMENDFPVHSSEEEITGGAGIRYSLKKTSDGWTFSLTGLVQESSTVFTVDAHQQKADSFESTALDSSLSLSYPITQNERANTPTDLQKKTTYSNLVVSGRDTDTEPKPLPPLSQKAQIKLYEQGEFLALQPQDLEESGEIFVVNQALDNQWVPRNLLNKMLSRGWGLQDVENERSGFVRTEYLRSLINAPRTVINRAFLYNNPSLSQDFGQQDANRAAFCELLNSGIIVPFLFNEEHPAQPPAFSTQEFSAWLQVCKESRPQCVRLSWDHQLNRERISKHLGLRFHTFVGQIMTGMDPRVLLRDLGWSHQRIEAELAPFRKTLRGVAELCMDFSERDKKLTREHLYEKFIIRDDTTVVDGYYDKNKPYASELKQLFDLDYCVNLPDALGGFPLTPTDSLPRAVLQEWKQATQGKVIELEKIAVLLQQAVFDIVQQSFNFRFLSALTLSDILVIRQMDEWLQYKEALSHMLRGTSRDFMAFLSAGTGASTVYQSYVKLVEKIAWYKFGTHEKQKLLPWQPVPELCVSVAGEELRVQWTEEGTFFQVTSSQLPADTPHERVLTGQLHVQQGSHTQQHPLALAMNIDCMRGIVKYPVEQWHDFIQRIRDIPGFHEIQAPKLQQTSTINYAETETEAA